MLKLGKHYLYQKNAQKAIVKFVAINNILILNLEVRFKFIVLQDFGSDTINNNLFLTTSAVKQYITEEHYINNTQDLYEN